MFTDILEAEIKWCENNDGAMPEEFRKGFIAGLKQAIYLINAALQRIGWEEGVLENDGVWIDTRGLTLHEAVKPIQLSSWTCKKCSQSNNGLDDICQNCRMPKTS